MTDNPSPKPTPRSRARLAASAAPVRHPTSDRKQQAAQVVQALATLYPNAECALRHRGPFELIVATVLAAQCTDARVNQVTPRLFARYPDASALAAADPTELEEIVHPTGFFRVKARNLIALSRVLVVEYGGEVPADLDLLTRLPGVGRKTAHVVLGVAFGEPSGVVVDTHVKRVAYRLGLTSETDPDRVEAELARIIPRTEWIAFSHRLIEHGRTICVARRPHCSECPLNSICPRIGVEASC